MGAAEAKTCGAFEWQGGKPAAGLVAQYTGADKKLGRGLRSAERAEGFGECVRAMLHPRSGAHGLKSVEDGLNGLKRHVWTAFHVKHEASLGS